MNSIKIVLSCRLQCKDHYCTLYSWNCRASKPSVGWVEKCRKRRPHSPAYCHQKKLSQHCFAEKSDSVKNNVRIYVSRQCGFMISDRTVGPIILVDNVHSTHHL